MAAARPDLAQATMDAQGDPGEGVMGRPRTRTAASRPTAEQRPTRATVRDELHRQKTLEKQIARVEKQAQVPRPNSPNKSRSPI